MRIAVIGTGGIGGPYGASLAKAGAGVTFVARGAHLAAIRENGLRIKGDRGETHIWPARATDDIVSIGTVDVVLSCVKLWDVENVTEQVRPIVGSQTAVIPEAGRNFRASQSTAASGKLTLSRRDRIAAPDPKLPFRCP
jgi:2-dehydropantoate 2-reductase